MIYWQAHANKSNGHAHKRGDEKHVNCSNVPDADADPNPNTMSLSAEQCAIGLFHTMKKLCKWNIFKLMYDNATFESRRDTKPSHLVGDHARTRRKWVPRRCCYMVRAASGYGYLRSGRLLSFPTSSVHYVRNWYYNNVDYLYGNSSSRR